jgi:drug/metabolite transporter (DMT)-like permease
VKADLLALGAVVLWASLASLALQLSEVPPLLLTGIGLLIGSSLAIPLSRFRLLESWKVAPATLLMGVFGLFGYHLALFFALQNAPAAEANLINYLWPVGIVLLTPLLLPGFRILPRQLIAAGIGFTGAAFAILGQQTVPGTASSQAFPLLGYLAAFAAAGVWSTYSVLTRRRPSFKTAAVGLFALVSGLLAVGLHWLLEEPYYWQQQDLIWIILLGFGPLGLAFYLWDAALKIGDPIRIGIISFLTPLLSTTGVLLVQQRPLSAALAISALLIVGAGVIGMSARGQHKKMGSQ